MDTLAIPVSSSNCTFGNLIAKRAILLQRYLFEPRIRMLALRFWIQGHADNASIPINIVAHI